MSVASVRKPLHLVDQEQALTRYLEALLSSAPELPTLESEDALNLAPSAPSSDADELTRTKPAPAELSLVMVQQGEMQLAFPLVDLAGVRTAAANYARPPRSAPGVLGLYAYRNQHIPVVSLEYALDLSIPGQSPDASGQDAQVLILGDGRWALQVDQVLESVRVRREGVRWRDASQRVPWLLGYLRAGLVSLIDVNAIVRRLDEKRRGMEPAFQVNAKA